MEGKPLTRRIGNTRLKLFLSQSIRFPVNSCFINVGITPTIVKKNNHSNSVFNSDKADAMKKCQYINWTNYQL